MRAAFARERAEEGEKVHGGNVGVGRKVFGEVFDGVRIVAFIKQFLDLLA